MSVKYVFLLYICVCGGGGVRSSKNSRGEFIDTKIFGFNKQINISGY